MSNLTQGMSETQDAVNFINTEVSSPNVEPLVGSAKTMIDQSAGMMVQDLQSFLKGFEQISLVALAKLANNILTYGNYYNPANDIPGGSDSLDAKVKSQAFNESAGSDVIESLFKIVSDYGEAKSKISALVNNTDPSKSIVDSLTKSDSEQESSNEDDNNTQKQTTAKNKTNWFSRKK